MSSNQTHLQHALVEITRERTALAALRSTVTHLRHDVTLLEALVTSLGPDALVMPDDLPPSHSHPRINGITVRIHQTYQLSEALSALTAAAPARYSRSSLNSASKNARSP